MKCILKRKKKVKKISYDLLNNYGYASSLKLNACVDVNNAPIPWYTYPSIEYFNQFDYSNKRIFEFGCGNSSLFWANRAKEVFSVESSPVWYDKIVQNKPDNLKIILETDMNEYPRKILGMGKFDVIVIDGFVRNLCVKEAIGALNDGGFIILDNSDRVSEFEDYADAAKILKNSGLIQVDFFGFGPLNPYAWCTSVFLTKNFNIPTKSTFQPIRGINSIRERQTVKL